MAKFLPNPANLSLFKTVMAPSPGLKTEVTIYAADLAQARSKVEGLWGFSVLSVKMLAAKEPEPQLTKPAAPVPPSGYRYTAPNEPLGLFAYCHAVAPTETEAHAILLALEQHVTKKLLVDNCTEDKKLAPDKPSDGVSAFIWQLARYMGGYDSHMSSIAFIDLIDGTSKLTHLRVDPSEVKTIMKFLEAQAGHLVKATNKGVTQ